MRPDFEGSDDLEVFPIGSLRYWTGSGEYLELVGARSSGSAARLAFNVVDGSSFDGVEFGPMLQYRFERDDVDSTAVELLGKVDAAIEAGVFFKVDLVEDIKFTGAVAKDVSDKHDGSTIEIGLEHTSTPIDTLRLTTGIASTWASNDYANAYFAVTAAGAAASGLTQYDPDSGFKDVGLRVNAVWAGPGAGWEHLRILGLVSWFRMIGDAKDSPIVSDEGNDNQLFGGLAVGWEG